MSLKEQIRSLLPNWFWLHSMLSKQKIKQFYRYRISEEDIREAESDYAKKAELVDKLTARWKQYSIAVDKEIDRILANAPKYIARNDHEFLRCDMRFSRFAYGFQPDEYLCFDLEGKSIDEKRAFVSDLERSKYVCQMNDIVDFTLFMDKARTYERFGEFYCREATSISCRDDLDRFMNFVESHPVFVRKRTDLSKGDSVEKVDTKGFSGDRLLSIFDDMVSSGNYIVEELVCQSATMAAFNSSSVNTIRCITFNTEDGIESPYCFMKVGHEGSFVDNAGAGGLLIGVDVETGRLGTDAFDEFGSRYEFHPDTGVRFKGSQLPDWQSMLEICKTASRQIPSVGYIGWDMAHTDDGWVVIEGNGGGQMIGPQIVWQRGIKADVEEIMGRMRLYA